jgi:putative transposase
LNQQESGRSVRDICREHAIAEGTFYQWKNKYGGMVVSDVKRLKELEEENFRLKRMLYKPLITWTHLLNRLCNNCLFFRLNFV